MKRLISFTRVLLACGLALGIAAAPMAAEKYPDRPVRIIVAFQAGQATDQAARIFAQKLTEMYGQSFYVENRPGAASIIGTEIAARAAPDGYTLFMGSSGSLAVNPGLYRKLPYDPNKDLHAVTLIASSPFLLLVHPSVPARSVKELIALAKAKPGALNYGSGGVGSSGHLAAVLFSNSAGVELNHIPYKGAGPALIDTIGGQLQLVFASIVSGMPFAASGKLNALGITTAKRSSAMPDMQTIAESGLPGYDFSSWYGLLVPAATPRAIVVKLNAEVRKALAQPDFKERLSKDGSEAVGSTPEEFSAFLKTEMATWQKVVKATGIQVE